MPAIPVAATKCPVKEGQGTESKVRVFHDGIVGKDVQ